jgi:peptidoglycan/LPS O-acetylase OafA/YrhL
MNAERFIRAVTLAGAAVVIVAGAWAFLGPGSFYERVAHLPPYNRHFLHDVGAFQLGLGAALALGLAGWDGRRVALWTVAVVSVLHAASHIIDRDLGGRGTDSLALTLVAAALLAAALLTGRPPAPRRETTRDPTPDHGHR